jgi:hypothetical protein
MLELRRWRKAAAALAVLAALPCAPLRAQLLGPPPDVEVLVVGKAHTPLSYQAVLARLDIYYQEQVGHKLAMAFPVLEANIHFDLWHEMWVFFEPSANGLSITMKRHADSTTARLAKFWMVDFAGRVGAEETVAYQELPGLRKAEAEVYATRSDLAAAFTGAPSLKLLSTWKHAALMISSSPLTLITLVPNGLHAMRRATVYAESAASAKQLLARLLQSAARPCICAVYSEALDLDAEITGAAQTRAEDPKALASSTLILSQMDPRYLEEKIRSEPEMKRRLAASAGYFTVRYRIDKPFRKTVVRWVELTGYSRDEGKHEGERPLGEAATPNPRITAAGTQNVSRVKLGVLAPGAYRITLEGENAAGAPAKIDERTYWFDGKTFEEI